MTIGKDRMTGWKDISRRSKDKDVFVRFLLGVLNFDTRYLHKKHSEMSAFCFVIDFLKELCECSTKCFPK